SAFDSDCAGPIILLLAPAGFFCAELHQPIIRMPLTEIILTENIPGLGAEADVVKVRRGYARNFLLPKGKAYEVTKSSLRQLDNLKAKRASREATELN